MSQGPSFLKEQLQKIVDSITDLREYVGQNTDETLATREEVSAMREELGALQNSIEPIAEELQLIREENGELKETVAQLKETVAQFRTQLENLEIVREQCPPTTPNTEMKTLQKNAEVIKKIKAYHPPTIALCHSPSFCVPRAHSLCLSNSFFRSASTFRLFDEDAKEWSVVWTTHGQPLFKNDVCMSLVQTWMQRV